MRIFRIPLWILGSTIFRKIHLMVIQDREVKPYQNSGVNRAFCNLFYFFKVQYNLLSNPACQRRSPASVDDSFNPPNPLVLRRNTECSHLGSLQIGRRTLAAPVLEKGIFRCVQPTCSWYFWATIYYNYIQYTYIILCIIYILCIYIYNIHIFSRTVTITCWWTISYEPFWMVLLWLPFHFVRWLAASGPPKFSL